MLELLMAHLRQARDKSYGRENLGWTIGFTPGLPRHCRERTNDTIWQKCVEVGHLYVTRHNSNGAGLHTIPRGGMNKQSVWEGEKREYEGGIFTVIRTTDHGIHTKTTLEGSEPSNVKCQGRRAPDTKDERTERSLNVRVVRMDKVQEKDRLSLTECRWGSDDADTKRLICNSPRLHLAYDKTEGCAKGAYRLNDEGAIFTFVRMVDDWIHTKTISKGSEPLEGCQVCWPQRITFINGPGHVLVPRTPSRYLTSDFPPTQSILIIVLTPLLYRITENTSWSSVATDVWSVRAPGLGGLAPCELSMGLGPIEELPW
ncbi:hypothetical protein EDD15DRAFT_2200716 [Pisolithus albus]|nr:hypothetical protein EDD15DRAFT_2200716 [Pisolithus albus]